MSDDSNAENGRSVLTRLMDSARAFLDDEPGKRFVRLYERRQKGREGPAGRVVFLVVGVLLVLAGLIGMPAPGPGGLVAVVGLGMLGSEVRGVASVLDGLEVRARAIVDWAQRVWRQASMGRRASIVGAGVILCAGAALAAYKLYTAMTGA